MLINESFKSNSPQKRPRVGLFLLVTSHWQLATALIAILLSSGCADATINNPIAEKPVEDSKLDVIVSTSTNYFPMTVGSRWVYRNADGSEWSREVAESQRFDTELYHSFSYNPPIQDSQLDSLGSAEYSTYVDRLVRRIKLKGINDAIWQIILQSGG